ncbi:MAG: hypothetical protein ACRDOB_15600 [Streptosporangiaceae bacterium]
MSQQAPDLPRSVQIIARYRGLIGFVALLGAIAGIIFAALTPPAPSSQALVMFTAPTCPAGGICGGPMFTPAYFQAMLLKQFPSGVQVKPAGGELVSINVAAGTTAQAEAIAAAAAADAGSVSYMGEHASLRVVQTATGAAAATPLKQVAGDALLGAVLGGLLGFIAAAAGSQTVIESPALARGLDIGAGDPGAGQPTRYATNGLTLRQLARESAERKAASDRLGDG